ncbi:MAG: site-2 protease family protein, partial [Anaerovoracaceae bacterium]
MRRFMSPWAIGILALMLFTTVSSGKFSSPMEWLMSVVMMIPGVVIGLAFHEFAHAMVADKLGDPTPRSQGRVTINPAAHIDVMGVIALVFIGFGWGKPVMINPDNFKNSRRDELLVSLAGVTMNLILAFIFTIILKVYINSTGAVLGADGFEGGVALIIFNIVSINLILMVFNLLPIPPLDGFNVITE